MNKKVISTETWAFGVCWGGAERIGSLLVKLDDAICYREKAITPEDRVKGIDEVDLIKQKIKDEVSFIRSQSIRDERERIVCGLNEKLPQACKFMYSEGIQDVLSSDERHHAES